ncbi:unnamed protein product, partial [Effrenium voratum]
MDAESLYASFLAEVGQANDSKCGSSPKRARVHQESERPTAADTLRKAAFHGQLSQVRQLLQGLDCVERLLLIDAAEADGLTALHLAAIAGHEAVCRALLDGRADVDAHSKTRDTALMWAAHQGRGSLCRLLLSHGADTTLKNCSGQTAA